MSGNAWDFCSMCWDAWKCGWRIMAAGLTPEDRVILAPRFEKLSRDAGSVAALSLDLGNELKTA
jgi:hypothetical protein